MFREAAGNALACGLGVEVLGPPNTAEDTELNARVPCAVDDPEKSPVIERAKLGVGDAESTDEGEVPPPGVRIEVAVDGPSVAVLGRGD